MILTCPECATRYFVNDGAVGDGGRTVRCTACGSSWRAESPPPLDLMPEVAAPAPPATPLSPSSELKAVEIPRAFRAQVEEKKRVREAAAQGAVWAGVAALVAVLIALALVFRTDVVRLWPNTASAYAAVGMPVNQVGLTIEKVQAQPALQDGRAALMVSGELRNIRSRAVKAPPLRVALLDKAGKRVGGTTARAGDPVVPPGGVRAFSVAVLDPPAAASEVEVTFGPQEKAAGAARPKPRQSREDLKLRPPAAAPAPVLTPQEAQPLPEGDPHALSAATADPH